MRWAEDDIDTVVGYRIDVLTERDGKPLRKEQRIDRPDTGAWTITDWEASGDSPLRMVKEVVWPYPFAPVLDCQNLPAANSYYGISDIETGLLESINGVNTILSNANKILRYHAHPKTIAQGFQAKDLEVSSDGVLYIPPGGDVHNLEMQGDLQASLALYQELMQVIFESARIPEVARGKLESIGNLSGVALRILYEPILEKTLDKRGLYGDLLEDLNRRLLYIGGYPQAEVEIVWPEIVPTDPKTDAETALLWQQAGVSQDTLLERAGFDPTTEARQRSSVQGSMAEAMLDTFNAGSDISE